MQLDFGVHTGFFASAQEKQPELLRLDNGVLSVGLKRESGGAIAWVSASGSEKNLVNAFDRGRLVQQSYYGVADGSMWNKTPWRWNPVQGGDWRGKSARLLELKTEPTGPTPNAYAKTRPMHWASGQELEDTVMEQTVTLEGPIVHIHYRFSYQGTTDHPKAHQELPAVFVRPELTTLVAYTGDAPWTDGALERWQPGWPNEYRAMTEHWAAYVDETDRGLGIYVPVADRLTCYRYGKDIHARDACSYVAPLGEFAITKGFHWEYDAYLSIGSVQELRQRFAALAKQKLKTSQENK